MTWQSSFAAVILSTPFAFMSSRAKSSHRSFSVFSIYRNPELGIDVEDQAVTANLFRFPVLQQRNRCSSNVVQQQVDEESAVWRDIELDSHVRVGTASDDTSVK